MQAKTRRNISLSVLITVVLFILMLAFCAPIIDSDDNFYILYTLAGGYGQPTTHLLHYFYEWHPFLFWPLAKLFRLIPDFNWYTGFLLLLQFIGCAHLLYLFLQLFSRGTAIILFILFFHFIESAFLLSLNHSNTSFLLAISGCSSFLHHFTSRHALSMPSIKSLTFPSFLLLVSGLLRVPTLSLYVLLTLGMGLTILPFAQYKRMFLTLAVLGAVLFTFMAAHMLYYTSAIPDYAGEEQLRQSLFRLANHPTAPLMGDTGITRVKNSFIQSWFLYDTGFVTQKDIQAYTQRSVQHRLQETAENRAILYWTFINSRVYLFLLGVIPLSFVALRRYRDLRNWLLLSMPALMVYLYLALFMKVTEGIFITLLSSIFLSAVFCFSREKVTRAPVTPMLLFLLLLNTSWMLVRIKKTNDSHLREIKETRSLLEEISTHPQLLFVHAGIDFRDRGFYIWDTPQQYPLKNLVNKELLITNTYNETLQRYGIKNLMEELPTRTNVILFDRSDLSFKEYYRLQKGMEVEKVKVAGFKSINAYQLKSIF